MLSAPSVKFLSDMDGIDKDKSEGGLFPSLHPANETDRRAAQRKQQEKQQVRLSTLTAQLHKAEIKAAAAASHAQALGSLHLPDTPTPSGNSTSADSPTTQSTPTVLHTEVASKPNVAQPPNVNAQKSTTFHTPEVLQLETAFASVGQHERSNILLSPMVVTKSSTTVNSLSALSLGTTPMVLSTAGQLLTLALNASKYSLVPHGALPVNEDDKDDPDNEFTGIGHVIPGSPGQDSFLQVGIDNKGSQDGRMTLLLVLLTVIDILSLVVPKFCLLPVTSAAMHPALTSGCEEDGFPTTTVIAFKYILQCNKRVTHGGSASPPPTPSRSHQHNDEEDYKALMAMWGAPYKFARPRMSRSAWKRLPGT
jgi:hypothetical protein